VARIPEDTEIDISPIKILFYLKKREYYKQLFYCEKEKKKIEKKPFQVFSPETRAGLLQVL
jgi:hypothetical protein